MFMFVHQDYLIFCKWTKGALYLKVIGREHMIQKFTVLIILNDIYKLTLKNILHLMEQRKLYSQTKL